MTFLPFFKKDHNQAILALIIANIIWGAASPIFKLSLENISPFTLAFLRFSGASLLLLPFTFTKLGVKRADWMKLVLLSIFGITVNISFFFLGLKYAPSINAPIISSAGPVFIYLFSIFFLHEKNHPKVLAGTIVSLLGVIIIIGQPLLNLGKGDQTQFIGNIFFLIAAVGSVFHAVICKEICEKYHALTITFWSFLIGAITFLPLFIFEAGRQNPFIALDYRGVFGILFGVFLSSALAYTLFDWGIKKIDAQEVGLFYYIDPIIAAIIAIPLLGEVITSVFLLGSLLVFSGIFIAEGRLHYHPLHKLRR